MALLTKVPLTASGTILLIPTAAGTGAAGWRLEFLGASWVGSVVLKVNTGAPGQAISLTSIPYLTASTGATNAADAAITASGSFMVQPTWTGYDLYAVYTHTSGSALVTVLTEDAAFTGGQVTASGVDGAGGATFGSAVPYTGAYTFPGALTIAGAFSGATTLTASGAVTLTSVVTVNGFGVNRYDLSRSGTFPSFDYNNATLGFRFLTAAATAANVAAVGTINGQTINATASFTGTLTVTGAFGCNTKAAQTAYASGGAATATGATLTTPYGYTTAAQANGIVTLLNNIRAALVANGMMS